MLAEGGCLSSTHPLIEERVEDVVETLLLKELLSPVGLESGRLLLFRGSLSSLRRIWVTIFLLLFTGVGCSGTCTLRGICSRGEFLLFHEHDSLRIVASLASLHHRDNDLLLVDLLEEARVAKDLRPVDTTSFLSLAEREHLLVNLLVRGKHADQLPHIL